MRRVIIIWRKGLILDKCMHILQGPAQCLLSEVKEDVETLTKILSAGKSFINTQFQKLSETEKKIAQYGYRPYAEVYRSDEKENSDPVKAAQDINTTAENNRPASSTPSKTKPLVDLNRTPKLEDAGISSDTLQYLNSMQKQKNTEKPCVPKNRTDFPSIFEHSGIICTPSLAKSLNADMTYNPDLHAALASPEIFPVAKRLVKEEKLDVPKVGATCRSIKPSAISQSEPAIHDFMTSDNYIAGEAPKPELTYSLEALPEMTGMFKINPLTKPVASVKPNSMFTIRDKENATPLEPEMLTERSSRIRTNQETAGRQGSRSHLRAYGDLPPSKLMGKP